MFVNKKPDERRCCQRINTQLSVDVVNRSAERMATTVTGLSAGGLTLQCDTTAVEHLEVIDTRSGEPYFPVEASILFTLPVNNTPSHFELLCRQVRKRRLSQNSFEIGMVIVEIDEQQREQLDHYVGVVGNA